MNINLPPSVYLSFDMLKHIDPLSKNPFKGATCHSSATFLVYMEKGEDTSFTVGFLIK